MPPSRTRFYGWPLVAVGWLLYGLSTAPFYSWGFFLPEMLEELGLDRGDGGLVFGLSLLFGGGFAPLVGIALGRFGLRRVMAAGFLVSSTGYFLTGFAQNLWQLIATYALFAASTHAFASVLPTQTLASTWFLRYRARVMAVLLTAAGILAPLVYAFNTWLLSVGTWRTGWMVIGALNVALGLIALAFVRDSPEAMGQLQDGAQSREEIEARRAPSESEGADRWTPGAALRTPQFALMVVCGLGYAVPWYVLTAHGRLHLGDRGFEIEAAAAILGSMALVSTLGRLGGALGDFVSPPRLLGVALTMESAGTFLFLMATSSTVAYVAVVLVGLGFGMAYISQAATFALFFGRVAFATTTGIRFMIGAIFAAVMPAVAGWVYDSGGSYAPAFLGLAAWTLMAALIAMVIRPPVRKVGSSPAAV